METFEGRKAREGREEPEADERTAECLTARGSLLCSSNFPKEEAKQGMGVYTKVWGKPEFDARLGTELCSRGGNL